LQHYGLPPFSAAVTDSALTSASAADFAPISQLQMQRFKDEKWELFGEIISGDVAAD
jgi:hypothetical protein